MACARRMQNFPKDQRGDDNIASLLCVCLLYKLTTNISYKSLLAIDYVMLTGYNQLAHMETRRPGDPTLETRFRSTMRNLVMIRAFTLSLAIVGLAFLTTAAAFSATIYKAKHGGHISRIGSYDLELVPTRRGDDVEFVMYVQDDKSAPILTGDMVLSVVGTEGKPQEVVLRSDGKVFRGTTTWVERGPIEIHETYTSTGGSPSVAVIKVPSI